VATSASLPRAGRSPQQRIREREIHALLKPVDDSITDLVRQGRAAGSFGRHLPADILGQIAFAAVFNIFYSGSTDGSLSAREANLTSLLTLGAPATTASELADSR